MLDAEAVAEGEDGDSRRFQKTRRTENQNASREDARNQKNLSLDIDISAADVVAALYSTLAVKSDNASRRSDTRK